MSDFILEDSEVEDSEVEDSEVEDNNKYIKRSYTYYFNPANIKNSNELRHINKNAPDGLKYCNAFCQDFIIKSMFSGQRRECKKCWSTLHDVKKQIDLKKFTIEDFRNNPHISNDIDFAFNDTKKCNICKQDKTLENFDDKKNTCKSCRYLQSKERTNKDMDKIFLEIERLKGSTDHLYKYLENMVSRDKLYFVLSHYNLKRKSCNDRKVDMINTIIQYFKQIMDPFLCRGGCGRKMPNEFMFCADCDKNKNKPRLYEKIVAFTENIDNIVKNLKRIEQFDESKFNKEQYYEISKKLGIKLVKSSCTKKDIINKINEFLDNKEKAEKEKNNKELEEKIKENFNNKKYELELNGFTVLARKEDGFINGTSLCKAGGKEFKHWKSLESTKELLSAFETENLKVGNPTFKSLDISKGKYGGSWVHPDLAASLAQWVSPIFALKVSKWVREIALTGNVTIGSEKTNEELIELQKQLLEKDEKIKNLEKKHNKILYKRKYHKFKEGSAFYILSTDNKKYKLGIDEISVNSRFQTYRTLCPEIKIHCIVYTTKCKLIEDIMLNRYECKKIDLNHEVIQNINIEHLLESVKHIIDYVNIDATFETEDELNKYNSC
jgi:hypothetical protein